MKKAGVGPPAFFDPLEDLFLTFCDFIISREPDSCDTLLVCKKEYQRDGIMLMPRLALRVCENLDLPPAPALSAYLSFDTGSLTILSSPVPKAHIHIPLLVLF